MTLCRLFAVFIVAASAAFADELIFVGTPSVRIDANGRETKKADFSRDAECRIVKSGRNYVWASRGKRRLTEIDAGDFVYYISPEGSGYVKVRKQSRAGSTFDYMEHLSEGFTTVTYWGTATQDRRSTRR